MSPLVWLILAVVAVVAILAAVHFFGKAPPCRTRIGWWRVPPPGVMPLEQGTARSLWSVVRSCANYNKNGKRARSFNFNPANGAYQLFEGWLVNWEVRAGGVRDLGDGTDPIDSAPLTVNPRITGALETVEGETCPHECVQKIRLDMKQHYFMDPDGGISPLRVESHPGSEKHYYKDKMLKAVSSGASGTPAWGVALAKKDLNPKTPPGHEILGASKTAASDTTARDEEIHEKLKANPRAFVDVDSSGNLVQAEPITHCSADDCESCSWCTNFTEDGKCTDTAKAWCNGVLSSSLIKDVYKPSDVKYSLKNVCTPLA